MRQYFTRRMLAIHALAMFGIAVCGLAANWQWTRAHEARGDDTKIEAIDFATASPLRAFMPASSIGRATSIQGSWIPNLQLVIDGRPADAHSWDPQQWQDECPWIVGALRLADDSIEAVVVGCSSEPDAVAMPVGNATVTGILQPSEDSDVMRIPSSVSRITTATLVQRLNSTVHDGYLVADTPIAGASSVTPRIPAAVKVPLHWRNVVYVGNWSTFAIIILAMWIRVSRDEAETTEAKREVQHS